MSVSGNCTLWFGRLWSHAKLPIYKSTNSQSAELHRSSIDQTNVFARLFPNEKSTFMHRCVLSRNSPIKDKISLLTHPTFEVVKLIWIFSFNSIDLSLSNQQILELTKPEVCNLTLKPVSKFVLEVCSKIKLQFIKIYSK